MVLSLTSNTTRLPNVAPYNTFSLNCTATVPEGVVAPKIFTWRKKKDSSEGFEQIQNGSNTVINNLESVNSSILTVTEDTAGDYNYECEVQLIELTTRSKNESLIDITVTEFCKIQIVLKINVYNHILLQQYVI